MSLSFIPTVWASRLLTALEKALIYGQTNVSNRDYEGEIRDAGNTVKIASIGDVTIGDYTKDTDINDPDILSDSDQTLLIDQSKYFNFYVDSVDRAQQNVNVMDEAMRRSAWALREVADAFLAGTMEAAVPGDNKIGSMTTPIVPTKANAYEYLVDLGVLLDEADVPIEGRFVVVPAWFHGLLLKEIGLCIRVILPRTHVCETVRSVRRRASRYSNRTTCLTRPEPNTRSSRAIR